MNRRAAGGDLKECDLLVVSAIAGLPPRGLPRRGKVLVDGAASLRVAAVASIMQELQRSVTLRCDSFGQLP
jgi:hypothetical protein